TASSRTSTSSRSASPVGVTRPVAIAAPSWSYRFPSRRFSVPLVKIRSFTALGRPQQPDLQLLRPQTLLQWGPAILVTDTGQDGSVGADQLKPVVGNRITIALHQSNLLIEPRLRP